MPKSASVEAFPLVRMGVPFENILKEMGRSCRGAAYRGSEERLGRFALQSC